MRCGGGTVACLDLDATGYNAVMDTHIAAHISRTPAYLVQSHASLQRDGMQLVPAAAVPPATCELIDPPRPQHPLVSRGEYIPGTDDFNRPLS